MRFEGTRVFGIENAMIGMRLPMCKDYTDAFNKSQGHYACEHGGFVVNNSEYLNENDRSISVDDLRVATNRVKADKAFCGQPESKMLRMIHVQVAITAPLYWWKEMDTYKVGTVANSTSTMHKLASTPIAKDCFEMSDFEDISDGTGKPFSVFWLVMITHLEILRQKYNETKDKHYWKELVRMLPESWLQTRMWDTNYEVLRNIYSQRKNHKLSEWSVDFCNWVKSLPYSKELITDGE